MRARRKYQGPWAMDNSNYIYEIYIYLKAWITIHDNCVAFICRLGAIWAPNIIRPKKVLDIHGLDQAVTESHFCCSSLDIFLMEKVRKSCFIWLCRALKFLLNGPSCNFPRKWFLGKKVKKHACYGITQNYHLFSTTLIKYHFHAVPATFFQKFLYHVVGKFVLHRFHHKVRCWIS